MSASRLERDEIHLLRNPHHPPIIGREPHLEPPLAKEQRSREVERIEGPAGRWEGFQGAVEDQR